MGYKNEITKEIKNELMGYINKTSNHLFTISDCRDEENAPIIKVIPFNKDGNLMYCYVVLTDKEIIVRIKKISDLFPGAKTRLKNNIFHQGSKHKSIRNFKVMRVKTDLAKKLLETDWSDEKNLKIMLENIFNN